MSLKRGTKLGPYEIVAPIGAGGMGEVYKAKDTRLDRTVAIKVLPSHVASNPEVRQRFEREARAVSSLNHPHICTLYDIGSENGIDFMVMELIEGDTLADRLKKGALPLDQALRYGIEIADALDKAHRQGVVHRDLKPGNIMLMKSGAKLLDFGLAKITAQQTNAAGLSALPTEAKPLTQEGSILGTFQYMAPEQLEGKEADAAGRPLCARSRPLRNAHRAEGFRRRESGEPHHRDHERRARVHFRPSAFDAVRSRAPRSEVPGEGSRGSLAEREGRDAGARMDSRQG